ncbi:vesicular-fusion protein SEC18 [Moesziomyces antarcticus]|uniref:Vesicular-fusion protein SEC18 n=2 Tax=Pseudozyma antarctica TaxID=84753 RepID=A0A081CEA4_PSEA2|nr:vesicular-fusion protein SEC18 [Moesziomyces antarcticus]GAK65000.1 vesicular-fusion protein SEC18 [Moesziomyces antarcticus]SPO46009.1 probable SEC18 - vesicular-fusion protein, functional homolog of NSF [Moesziomyces antarcticus]
MAGFLRGGGSGGAGYGRVGDGSDPYRDGRNPYTSSSASSGRSAAGGAGYGGAGFAGAGAGGAGRTAGGAGFRAGGAGFAGGAGGAGFSGGAGGAGGGGAPYASEKSSPRPRMGGGHLVVKCPEQLILSNCLIVNGQEWGSTQYVLVEGMYVFTAQADPTGAIQPGTLGTAKLQRQWAGLSAQGQSVEAVPYDPFAFGNSVYLGSIDIEVAFIRKGEVAAQAYDTAEMAKVFARAFENHIFTTGQLLVFEFKGMNLIATIRGVDVVELHEIQQRSQSAPQGGHAGSHPSRSDRGILIAQTQINFSATPDGGVKLKASGNRPPPNAILQPNFKFEDMGVGGLDKEFANIFRRAFASRIFPPALVEKLGIQHVKGMVLYGPPGTGKTLLARQIGKMLNAREPKIVNGPEVFNKYVGGSEENVRKLFADAEKEQKDKGDESQLHIIILDELDAMVRQRGSGGAGATSAGDNVVNTLLAKLDGVEQLNNILVIGMTNRLDMIDEALLRPGRLEVHVEVSLPDEFGRRQILNIHTSKMRTNGVMDGDVNIDELAALTKNFSGAEIAGLIKSATSFAFNRHVKVGTMAGISNDVEDMKVMHQDFLNALEEVKPAFGVAEEELSQVVQNGIMHFAPHIDVILRDGHLRVEQVRTSQRTPLVTVLLHGPPGSGKTALAATIAIASDYPFIKLISPESMIGMGDAQKINYLNKVFNDAYKSPLSIVVIDNIEKIVEWVRIGPRFSNSVLQALAVLLGKRPPKDKRLLVLATTSNRRMLHEMEMLNAFIAEIRVPNITSLRSVDHVVRQMQLFEHDGEAQRCQQLLAQAGLGEEGKLNIGIKKLLSEIEMARLDNDPADRLASSLSSVQNTAIDVDIDVDLN